MVSFFMFGKNLIFFCFICFNSLANDKSIRLIEIYGQNNSIFSSDFMSHFDWMLKATLNTIMNLYSDFFNVKNEVSDVSRYFQILYRKIITLKEEKISLDKKLIKLFALVQENAPDKKNRDFILKIYKKLMSVLL